MNQYYCTTRVLHLSVQLKANKHTKKRYSKVATLQLLKPVSIQYNYMPIKSPLFKDRWQLAFARTTHATFEQMEPRVWHEWQEVGNS